ncbi:uncharacterized protein TRIADDRAFT_55398 [Trichoplax adhaerens]|uniref:FAM194 C-terminal domain-containing protein n=1 Tax=Trichoplax adhaerens TaxID=10228 RepID=B3RUS8_TRIAD|nr:predicted protein [Trichoplax adhaerens]EDV25376.1 predicted protein [Trichoplax adhaerens]|eukprot:XP_002111409.1 predicted protein [Trichoplax adhaerens]
MGDKTIYFFDQIDPRKDRIRQRKSTVDLPPSLRQGYARAAELIKRAQINQASVHSSGDNNNQSSPSKEINKAPTEDTSKPTNEVKGNDWRTSKGYFTGENGLKFAELPVIPTEQYVQVGLANKNEKYDLRNIEEEDTQRFLLEEAKFAFPGVLVQISKLLNLFHDQNIIIQIPDDLRKQLFYTFNQLSKDAVYSKREWQTAIYRDLALGQKEEAENAKEAESHGKKRSKAKYSRQSRINSEDSTKDDKNKEVLKSSLVTNNTNNNNINRKSMKDNEGSPKTVTISDRGTRLSTTRDRTRSFGNKPDYRRIATSGGRPLPRMIGEEAESEAGHGSITIATNNVIYFSMQSRWCHENGWIQYSNIKGKEPEQESVAEWLKARLTRMINQRNQMLDGAKARGEDGPFAIRFYGEARDRALLRLGRPTKRKILEENKRQKFWTRLPDGCQTAFYPTGKIAVLQANSGLGKPGQGCYSFIYDDNEEHSLIGYSVPSGKGCCYKSNKEFKFIWNDQNYTLFDDLNEHLVLRCHSSTHITLQYSNEHEVIKFNLGLVTSARKPPEHLSDLGYLKTNLQFSSDTAAASRKPQLNQTGGTNTISPPTSPTSGKKKSKNRGSSNDSIEPTRSLTRKKTLTRMGSEFLKDEPIFDEKYKDLIKKFPELLRMGVETRADRELYRLRRKIRTIVDDWLEYYRFATDISSPFMNFNPNPAINSTHPRSKSAHHKFRVATTVSKIVNLFSKSKFSKFVSNSNSFDNINTDALRVPRSCSAPPIPKRLQSLIRPKSAPLKKLISKSDTKLAETNNAAKNETDAADSEAVTIRLEGDHGVKIIEARPSSPLSANLQPRNRLNSPINLDPRLPSILEDGSVINSEIMARRSITPSIACPIMIRSSLLGQAQEQCRCSPHKIPYVSDLEFDEFINKQTYPGQLLIINVVSSMFPVANKDKEMLERIYYSMNRNRTMPCQQARRDIFRLLKYDMVSATKGCDHSVPILLKRHHVIPGMFLMYNHGRLIFADHILNGYSSEKKDFMKQVIICRKLALEKRYLPQDFKFALERGKKGTRAPWGGDMGTENFAHWNNIFKPKSVKGSFSHLPRIPSALSSTDSDTVTIPQGKGTTISATKFITVSLSYDDEILAHLRKKMAQSEFQTSRQSPLREVSSKPDKNQKERPETQLSTARKSIHSLNAAKIRT